MSVKFKDATNPDGTPAYPMAKRRTRGRCGRQNVIAIVDALMEEAENVHQLAATLQERFNNDPIAFVKELVIPLTPKTMMEGDTGNAPEDKAQEIRDNLKILQDNTFGAAPPPHALPPSTMAPESAPATPVSNTGTPNA